MPLKPMTAKKPSKSGKIRKKDLDPDAPHLPVPARSQYPTPSGDLIQIYLREIAQFPLLSPEKERQLTEKYYETKNPEILKVLIQSNLRFVVKIAFEYVRYGAKVMDLVQEGNMGLIKAVQDFNPYKDVRLTTYAVWWIRSYIQDFLIRNWSIVRIGTTAAQKKLFYNLKKEQERLERLGMKPAIKQIAANLGVTEKDVEVMEGRLSGRDLSLSNPVHPESGQKASYEERVASESESADQVLGDGEQALLFKKALQEFIVELDERERDILENRLLSENPKTLIEIGDAYGFTKERARQLEERIKEKLKDFLARKYPDITMG
jgi:RNA polymerase sigma-32 factor